MTWEFGEQAWDDQKKSENNHFEVFEEQSTEYSLKGQVFMQYSETGRPCRVKHIEDLSLTQVWRVQTGHLNTLSPGPDTWDWELNSKGKA